MTKEKHSASCFGIFPQLKVLVPQNLTCMHHAHMNHPDFYKYNTQSTQLPLTVHNPSTHKIYCPLKCSTMICQTRYYTMHCHYLTCSSSILSLLFFSLFTLSRWYGWNCFVFTFQISTLFLHFAWYLLTYFSFKSFHLWW